MTDETNNKIVDVVKKKRKRPDLSELQTPTTEPGEIGRMLSQIVEIGNWPPINTDDPKQLADRFNQYHQFCIARDIKPDMPGLALAAGTTRTTLWRWENGIESNKSQEVRNVIKKAREINEIMMTQMMANGKINPVAGIFFLKNSHLYVDSQEVVLTPNSPMDNGDPAQVRSRYVQALPEDTEGTETE